MATMPTHKRKQALGKWQARAASAAPWLIAGLVILIALGLAAYAAAASYDTVAGQAVAHGVSLPHLNPLGIDGGLFGIITLDIGLTVIGRPIWWLRLAARLFAIGTIAANASAGWPSPVGVGLRVAAPALFVLIVEAGRHVLLHRDTGTRGRIPVARWLLAPVSTAALWRRMKLWDLTDYRVALDMELSRRQAIVKLEMKYPAGWREAAPADLVWMLRDGVKMTEVLAMVAELTAPEPVPVAVLPTGPARRSKAAARGGPRPHRTAPKTVVADDLALEAKALELLAGDLTMSGAALARELGVSESYGRKLRRRLTQPDRPAVPVPAPVAKRTRTARKTAPGSVAGSAS